MHFMKYERSDAPTLPVWLRRLFHCCHPLKGRRGAYEEIPMQEINKKKV
jgi:hypothetical protein